jgi:hypothetical protein
MVMKTAGTARTEGDNGILCPAHQAQRVLLRCNAEEVKLYEITF